MQTYSMNIGTAEQCRHIRLYNGCSEVQITNQTDV